MTSTQTEEYDYEFIFVDDFQQDVYDAYPIPDTDETLVNIVTDIVDKLVMILRVRPGIRCICSFGTHDDQRLKITVINSTWIGETFPM